MSSAVSSVIAHKELVTKLIKASSRLDFYTVYPRSKSWPPLPRNENNNNKNKGVYRMLVLDSSFNPPTKAHSELVHVAKNAYPNKYFDATLLLFSTNNADKKLTGASVEQRVQMMELMAESLSNNSDVAVGLTPHGKFVDKATHISRWFQSTNDSVHLELYFIVGYDTMIRLMNPKYYVPVSVKDALAPFFEACHLICADRPNDDDKELFWKNTFDMFGNEKIKKIELDPTTAIISSTKVRLDVDHTEMVQDDILEYIRKSNLYK